MAFVRVEQRNARLASAVKVEYVKGREGEVAKGTVTIISNTRRGSGDDRAEEATAIQWTLWGAQAENAGVYLGKGSRVNVVGRLRNNNYTDGEGRESKAESDARRSRQGESDESAPTATPQTTQRRRASRNAGQGRGAAAN